jgi:hypothetical protein
MTTVNTIDCLYAASVDFSDRLGNVLSTHASELADFLLSEGHMQFVHGSLGFDVTVRCVVPGSDADVVVLSCKTYDDTVKCIEAFCAERGWRMKVYDRNILTFFPGNGLLKIDLLMVKNTQVAKNMPSAFSWMGGEYLVYESLRGSVRGDIDVNSDAFTKIYWMTQAIKESQLGTVAHFFLKTIIKAYGIAIPSVALTGAMVGSISRFNSSPKEGQDSKYGFSTLVKNCLNILKAIGVVSRTNMPTPPFSEVLQGCFNVGHRDPHFEVITPFQGMLVDQNVGSLGDVLFNLHILDADLQGLFADAKSQHGTLNIALLACALRHADEKTLDPVKIKEMFSTPLQSDLLNDSIKKKVQYIQNKLTEKDALKAAHKVFLANTARDEVQAATNKLLQENFSDIHFPAVASREIGGTTFFSASHNTILNNDN